MDLILELLQLEEAAVAKPKAGKNPTAKDTVATKVPAPKKEPTKKQADKENKKEATFKVDGQSGKLVQPSFAPQHKFCKGDKVKIATGADERYGAHVGKCGSVTDAGYCHIYRDATYSIKLDGGSKTAKVYERDLQAA